MSIYNITIAHIKGTRTDRYHGTRLNVEEMKTFITDTILNNVVNWSDSRIEFIAELVEVLPHTLPFEYLRTHTVAYNKGGGVDMILKGDSLSAVPREDWEELEDFLLRTEGNYSVIRSTLNGVECRLSFKNNGVDLEGYDTEPDITVVLSVGGLVTYATVKEFEYCGNLNIMFGNILINRD